MMSGDTGILQYLYRRYSAMLYGFICNTVADEKEAGHLLQAAYTEIWKCRKEYKAGAHRLFTWMLGITRRQIDLKGAAKQNIIDLEIHTPKISVNTLGVLHTDAEYSTDGSKKVYLPDLHQFVFDLIYVNGLTVIEVAGIAKLSVDDIKKMLRLVMNKIKKVQHG